MARTLSAAQEANLDGQSYIGETLVEITYDSTTLYYTTGYWDVSISTPTSGGTQTYLGDSKIQSIASIDEIAYFTEIRSGIVFNGISTSFIDTLGLDYDNITVVMYKIFRVSSDNTIDTSSDPIEIFNGYVVGKSISADQGDMKLQLDLSNQNINRYRTNGADHQLGTIINV